MDPEELLRLLEKDLDEDPDIDEDLIPTPRGLLSTLKINESHGIDEELGKDDDWDSLLQSSMEVNHQFDNYQSVVNETIDIKSMTVTSEATTSIIQFEGTNLAVEPQDCLVASETIAIEPLKVKRYDEVFELMDELLSAVERAAPIFSSVPLDTAVVAIDLSSLPTEFVELEFDRDMSLSGSQQQTLLVETILAVDANVNDRLQRQIELEELKLREAEEEAERMIQRDLELRMERKKKRNEEMTRVLNEIKRNNASIIIQCLIRKHFARAVVQDLRRKKEIYCEQLRIEAEEAARQAAELARLRELEEKRKQAEIEQRRLDRFIASREGVSMMMEDALSNELRAEEATRKEDIEMKCEDELSVLLRESFKSIDVKQDAERVKQREMVLQRKINKVAFENATVARAQEFRSVWNTKVASASSAASSTKRSQGSEKGWGGAFASANPVSTLATMEFNYDGLPKELVDSATNLAIGRLCEPLSVLQHEWDKLVSSTKERSSLARVDSSLPVDDLFGPTNFTYSMNCLVPISDTSSFKMPDSGASEPIEAALRRWTEWTREMTSPLPSRIGEQLDCSQPRKMADPTSSNCVDSEASLVNLLGELGMTRKQAKKAEILKHSVEGLTSCEFLVGFPSLKELELNVNRISKLNGLRGLTQLERLSIKDNRLEDVFELQYNTTLKSIRLDSNQIVALEGVDRLPNLSLLSATGNKLTSIPALGCPKLQKLELYKNFISVVPQQSLQNLPSLTHLDLGRNKLEFIPGESLSACSLLNTLILSQNLLSELPSPLFLPHLRHLWVSGNRLINLNAWAPSINIKSSTSPCEVGLGPCASENWKFPIFLPMLEKLHLQDNAIAHVNVGVFCTMPLLNYIDLSFNNLNGLPSLVGLSVGLTPFALKTLQLQDNPLTRTTDPTRVLNDAEMAEKLNALDQWLMSACPGLSILSGNTFTGSYSLPLAVSAPTTTIDSRIGSETNHTMCKTMISEFRRTGKWSSLPNPQVSVAEGSFRVSKGVLSYDDAINRQIEVAEAAINAIISDANQSGELDRIDSVVSKLGKETNRQCQLRGLQNATIRSRKILHLLGTFAVEQNTWRSREKFHMSQQSHNNSISERQAIDSNVYDQQFWEDSFVKLLTQQVHNLLLFSDSLLQVTDRHAEEGYFISHSVKIGGRQKESGDDTNHSNTSLVPITASDTNIASRPGSKLDDSLGLELSITASDPKVDQADFISSPVGSSRRPAVEPEFHRGENYPHKIEPSVSHLPPSVSKAAATNVQRIFRGSRTRRMLAHALDSAKYYDEEIDGLMARSHLDDLRELGLDELLEEEEFDPKWIYKRSNLSRQREWRDEGLLEDVSLATQDADDYDDDHENSQLNGESVEANQNTNSLVYGDLQRGRRSRERMTSQDEILENRNHRLLQQSATTAWDRDATLAPTGYGSHHYAGSISPYGADSSRPMSTSTDVSSVSAGSAFGSLHQHSSELSNQKSDSSPRSGSRLAAVEGLAEEWGIQDPHLLEVLMKRNKRMRHFANAKEVRERNKDPEVRLQKFLKSAGGGHLSTQQPQTRHMSGNSNTAAMLSGSFGGKPRGGGARRGGAGGRSGMPNSWMQGYRQQAAGGDAGDTDEK